MKDSKLLGYAVYDENAHSLEAFFGTGSFNSAKDTLEAATEQAFELASRIAVGDPGPHYGVAECKLVTTPRAVLAPKKKK